MFSKYEKDRILEALDDKIKSMKRMANSRPTFKEVADKATSEYNELRFKVEKLDEVSKGGK